MLCPMEESDVERLLLLFRSGTLLRPDAGVWNSVDLARAMAVVAGARAFADETSVNALAAMVGESDHVVFVLADGLGLDFVERLPAGAFLQRHLAAELRAVFPSSTAPALTSLATGTWPAAHAVPAWFTYLPRYDLTATVLPFVARASGRSLPSSIDAGVVFPASVQAPAYRRDFAALQPAKIAGSVYSRYSSGGASRGYEDEGAAVQALVTRVQTAERPSFTYLYWPDVDAAAHEHGPEADEVWQELLRLDAWLSELEDRLGERARIVVSADHGLIPVPEDERRVIADGDALQAMLRVWPPAGEPRAPFFHVKPGQRAGFERAFRARFGDVFVLLSTDEAEELRLFGPAILSPETRARVGNYIAVPTGAGALGYAGEPGILRMKGFHGGLSPQEMRVPLVVA
jgi:hypothetical protein